ncbi:hypothetical protein Taro_008499 [Colocasia esculenta]|uniref:Uncharacterized protein n=1 Tax=Colocasia esculenta TaxID=4460 RepID=A0A843U382_COLES|nr:hypothetical protein [Colocasia esculenta]
MLTTHTAGNARRTSRHHDYPITNSCDSKSLPEESRGMSLANKAQQEQHNVEANTRRAPAEIEKLTEHRSNHVRPESHDTTTNIPDLHEVGEVQPGVTKRDTEKPREKQRLTIGTATSDLHKVEGPQAEQPWTSGMPRGQETTHRCHHEQHRGTCY